MRIRVAVMAVLMVAMAAPTTVSGQSTPYTEYRSSIEAFADAESARQEAAGTLTTVADALARMDESVARQETEEQRLAAITPEPCYADAHAEFLGFWQYRIATFRDTRPLVEHAESVMGMLPMLLAADATIRAAHPLAYVEDAETFSGFRQEPTHILDALATCAPLPSSSPVASQVRPSSVPTGSPPPPQTIFTDSGNGTKNTAPFELVPGDYRLGYAVRAKGSDVCGLGFALVATDDSYRADVGNDGAWVYSGHPYRNETWFHVPTAGRFYLDVGGDCAWEVQLESAPSPLDGLPIALKGSGLGTSPSFSLPAGDYIVRYVLKSPRSDENCSISASGIIDQAAPYQDLGGDISMDLDAGATVEGETYVYGLEAGRYAYKVSYAWCQFGLSEPVSWEVTIEAQ